MGCTVSTCHLFTKMDIIILFWHFRNEWMMTDFLGFNRKNNFELTFS